MRNPSPRRALSRVLSVVIVVVILLAAVAGAYYFSAGGPSKSTTSQTTGSTSLTSQTTAARDTLVVEEGSQPDSADPAADFTTAGNELTFNVYQGLVAPNLESVSSFVGVLASNWTESSGGMTWTFSLRHGVTFSNGDQFNAYVMWYSLYRSLVMNQVSAFILAQNFGKTNGGGPNITDSVLNSMEYTSPSAANLTLMETPGQSFQVISQYEIALNLGYGYNGNVTYSAFLVTLTAPIAFAVDPKVVLAHGGVSANQPNAWMQTNAVGTSFYELSSWVQGQSVKLVKSPNYWGNSLSSSELNYALSPAILNTIIIYYKPTSSRIVDLKSGTAQMIGAPDITEAANLNDLKQTSGVNVTNYPIQYGSALSSYFVFMNPFTVPAFKNILVRQAVASAIDYKGIISNVFKGLAQQWVGPVPPGYPLYNETTSGITPYTFNATRAAQLLAQAGYVSKLPSGVTLNPTGTVFPTLNFVYSGESTSETQVSAIIQSELQAIGINTNLVSLPFAQYTSFLFSTSGSNSTGGFGISYWSEDYPASQDYVTGIAGSNYTGAPTTDANVSSFSAAADSATDSGTILQAFRNVTTTMYNGYTDVWLYVPVFIAVNDNSVVGMVPNLDGPCAGYFMYYNTVHFSS
ncbi:MAG: ABC transporter substrate-binding protein [Thaumarchaeota archaeon]|nr:ABC transporter substrate-binding protein [Nitrososphaerota archaeon]